MKARQKIFISIFLVLSGCSWLESFSKKKEEDIKPETRENAFNLPPVKYITSIKGGEKPLAPKTAEYLKEASALVKLENKPPNSLNALYKRAYEDMDGLKEALYSKGFFDSEITYDINDDVEPCVVTLKINTKTRYKIDKILIESQTDEDLPDIDPIKLQRILGVFVGQFVELGKIKDSSPKIANYMRHLGYPFVESIDPEGVINRDTKKMAVKYIINLKGKKRLDGVKIHGLKTIDPIFIKNRLLISPTQYYDEREKAKEKAKDHTLKKKDELLAEDPFYDEKVVERNRQRLLNTSLFAGVIIEPKQHPTKSDYVYLDVQAEEAPHRTVGAGLRYATSEGIGGNALWSHDNFRGYGQKFEARLEAMGIKKRTGRLSYSTPDFMKPRQNLRQEINVTHKRQKSYDAQGGVYTIGLERPLTRRILGTLALEYAFSRERKVLDELISSNGPQDVNQNYVKYGKWQASHLLGVPLKVKYDSRNDVLNPTKGGITTLVLAPYKGHFGASNYMVVTELRAAYYKSLSSKKEILKDSMVVGGWLRAGYIMTKSVGSLPLERRLFSGGAASNRGYGYELLGPLNQNGKNIGAQSLIEGGVEFRYRFNQDWGGAVFSDITYIPFKKRNNLEKFEQLDEGVDAQRRNVTKRLFPSIGLGIAYYTSLFPIRVNIAMPLVKRKTPDGKLLDSGIFNRGVQIQVTLGQLLPE